MPDEPAAAVTLQRAGGPGRSSDRPQAASGRRRIARGLQLSRFSGLYVWAAFILIFAVWVPDTFLTAATAKSIAGDQAIATILSLGVLFTLACGEFDLSIAQNLGLSATVAGALMAKSGVSPVVAIVVTLVAGATIGAVNGGLVAVVGVNSFIATLGTTSVLLALTEIVSDNQFIGPVPDSFRRIASGEALGVPSVTIYCLVLAALAWYVLEHTPVGRRIYATGGGADAARLAGVRTTRYVFCTFVASGVIASVAGVLVVAKIGSVSPDIGPPYLLPAFAACFLGITQLKPGRFNVWGTVLALYLLATGVKGLQLVGGQLWITDLFNGVALVGAVSLARYGEKRRVRRSARERVG